VKKVLTIRFSSIGDIVITGGLFKAIKKYDNSTHISVLTKDTFAPLLQSNPFIDEVITIHDKTNLFTLIQTLKKKNFSLILDLHNNLRSFIIKNLLFIPSFSVFKNSIGRRRLVSLKSESPHSGIRVMQRYFETAEKAGLISKLQVKKHTPYLNIPAEIIDKIRVKLHMKGFKNFITVAPEANWQTKKWTKFPELVKLLSSTSNTKMIIIGKKRELHFSRKSTLDLSGQLSIMESAAVISLSSGVICNDTGIMHIADALKVPTISIWGPTVKEFGFSPFHKSSRILEIKNLKCRPCSLHGSLKCPKKHFKCMNLITVQDVVDELKNAKII